MLLLQFDVCLHNLDLIGAHVVSSEFFFGLMSPIGENLLLVLDFRLRVTVRGLLRRIRLDARRVALRNPREFR